MISKTSTDYAGCLREAAQRLGRAGIEEARLEARLLMLAASGLTAAGLISAERDEVPPGIAARFEAMIAERETRRPLQHIVGTVCFYGLDLLCDDRALIPRPDSEIVVEAALALLPEDRPVRVADLGTGSGCLLAALLSARPLASGEGVEASHEAAALARENLAGLGLDPRAGIFDGSWTEWEGWPAADLIISNPPYIASAGIATLAPEVRAHDPLAALDGGADGLDAYREIVSLAAAGMKPGAALVFEIGHDQKDAVCRLMSGAGFSAIGTAQDLGGNDRAVWGLKQG
ncbi:MAG: peptide chain release factor N(5)-glutamine methyltransferase [Hyphomonas sp.]|nr:peptide chain release factor N(5)-glutamine methyltransferase [Hyphomonas sp.]